MKIISPFKDYYDHSVHPSQIDESVRFIRRSTLRDYDAPQTPELLNQLDSGDAFYAMRKTVSGYDIETEITLRLGALCIGHKCYPVWAVPYPIPKDERDNLLFPGTNGYGEPRWYGAPSLAEMMKYVGQHYGPECKLETWTERDDKRFPRRVKDQKRVNRLAAEAENRIKVISSFDPTDLCLHYQTPLLLIVPSSIHDEVPRYGHSKSPYYAGKPLHVMLNPSLAAFHMQSVIDPYQAWQDISMFIGGVMPGRQSPMVQLTDESRIVKAGFDTKYSFRRRPESE